MGFDRGHFPRGHEIGDDAVGITAEVGDASGNGLSVFQLEGDGAVLVADFLAGLNDGLEQVMGAEFTAGAGEVGADAAPFLIERATEMLFRPSVTALFSPTASSS